MKAESLGTESNLRYEDAEAEPSVSDLDLKYADSEELYRQVFGYVEQQEDMLFDADVLVDGEKSGSAPTFIGKICKIQAASLNTVWRNISSRKILTSSINTRTRTDS